MAFRFKLDEPIQKGFRRIGLEQIERAERQLATLGDLETAIHESRKSLKRIRALLRLARPGLGDDVYRAENARFRSIAALLSPARDSHILLETVTKLELQPNKMSYEALAALRKVIHADFDCSRSAQEEGINAALANLLMAKKRFRRLALKPAGFLPIARGLEASYGKGRSAFAVAYSGGGDDAFHEWRKTVQQHWRHMALVSRAWPDFFNARLAAARALSQILGDDHDLSVLVTFARSLPVDRLAKTHVREIERRARARQKVLRKAAEPRGQQLFAEGARGHSRRIAMMWKAAGQMDEGEDEAPAAANPASEKPQPGKVRS
jgi:CHAD domain-containing protein